MQGLVRTLFAIGGALAFLNSAYAQSGTCANYQATQVQCYGPNNCHGYVAVIRPYFGSGVCLQPFYVACCETQVLDYSANQPCSSDSDCLDALKSVKDHPEILELSLTHALWLRDCTGHYGPFARAWDAPEKPINLSPKPLSGIGQ